MYILNFDEYLHLKTLLKKNFNADIHMHDTCQGQYFSLEKQNKKAEKFIKNYFKKKKLDIYFDNNGINFSLKDK